MDSGFTMDMGPSTLTILPTYRCTAACEQCCFGSNPGLKTRLDIEQIESVIQNAKIDFPALRLVVFSGGECTMLGKDLIRAIKCASDLGLKIRVVSNGHWGGGLNRASQLARSMKDAGLSELNISTGFDHSKFVPIESVIVAAQAATTAGIFCLITVESDHSESNVEESLRNDPRIRMLRSLGDNRFRLNVNTWMSLNDSHIERQSTLKPNQKSTPCNQIFNNLVITAHGEISSCCGLTFEHIPEMKIGHIDTTTLSAAHAQQMNDFMKIWIRVDGPDGILQKIYSNNVPKHLLSRNHPCETCARLHLDADTRDRIKTTYQSHVPDVLRRHANLRVTEAAAMHIDTEGATS